MARGVSVIICCYNSSARLPQTLRHLALQVVPTGLHWEIILIDNASTDLTASAAREIWAGFNAPQIQFRVLEEPVAGKNHAFKRGVREALFDYVLTCDDDNWLADDYIASGFQLMDSEKDLGALGGAGIIEAEQPARLTGADLNRIAVNGPQRRASADHWVYGAGSFYRKSIVLLLLKNGWQQITSGRKGLKLISGEDVEICFMIYLSGYRVDADERLQFRHFVPLHRQNLDYILEMSYWLSYSNVLLGSYYPLLNNDRKPVSGILRNWYIASAKALLKNILLLTYQGIRTAKQLTLEQKVTLRGNYGTFRSLFENRRRITEHHAHIIQLLGNLEKAGTGLKPAN